MKKPRETALLILYKTQFEGAYANLELKSSISPETDKRDRAFITSLVYGVMSRRLTLDYIIEQYSKIKMKKLSKYIHIILQMGLYQIFFTEKIPQSAAVNESVKLASRYGHRASAGFVNGILRAAASNGIKYPADGIKRLSVMYSFPEWICEKWVRELGESFTEEMLAALNSEPQLTLRPNRLKITAETLADRLQKNGAQAEVKNGAVVCSGLNVGADELYKQGFYTVQDRAAMTAAETLAPKAGELVIDMCAAPGGKTTHMAELMENEGKILAFDIHEHKIHLIEENAERLGISIITAQKADASKPRAELAGTADKVLCDVPCSGWGIVRRKPDIKYNRSPEDSFFEIQYAILKSGAEYLKTGGELVYSTCTVEKSENEGVTGFFLENNTDFEKVFEKTYYPNVDGTDGFYICKIRKAM